MAKQTKGIIQERTLTYRMPSTSGMASIRAKSAFLGLPELHPTSDTPNGYFAQRFPLATERYGPAFMEGTFFDNELQEHTVPSAINEDFFAALVGGEPRLGHEVVFYPQEDSFYFFDPRLNAFCLTTEDKIALLLSNYLIKCSQACGRLVDIQPLVTTFREPHVLQGVIQRAKAMHEVSSTFFQGEKGHRRYIDGRYLEPTDQPSYRLFVKRALVRAPGVNVTLSDAYHRYYEFCSIHRLSPLARSNFKSLVKEIIREEFGIGFRHDVPDQNGKQQHGWVGIDYRLPTAATHSSS